MSNRTDLIIEKADHIDLTPQRKRGESQKEYKERQLKNRKWWEGESETVVIGGTSIKQWIQFPRRKGEFHKEVSPSNRRHFREQVSAMKREEKKEDMPKDDFLTFQRTLLRIFKNKAAAERRES